MPDPAVGDERRRRVPLVDCLVLNGAEPHLVGRRCAGCGAVYLDRRNACGRCGGLELSPHDLARSGTVRTFTIVHRSPRPVPVPYVSVVVDVDGGGTVRATLVSCDPEPDAIEIGMRVRMTTFVAGVDQEGTEAVAFAFEPDEGA